MSNEITYRLGDVCSVINGKAYTQEELLENGKYKVLRVGNFFSNGKWYCSDLELEPEKYCDYGDLLFAWSASFGPKIWNEGKTIYHYHIWKLVLDERKVNRLLLYYILLNRTKSFLSSTHGSIMLHLTKTFMEDLKITVPQNIAAQQKIAAVLSALDAKIELNQHINTELESMAKTLYDYWFVQNAKVGKWQVGKLGDFIKINERSITKDCAYDEVEYIDIASVSVGRLEGTTKYALRDAPSRARRLVQHGDTIWSTVRPNRKSYLFICNPKENLVVSTGFAVLTPEKIPPSFLYFLTTTEQFVNFLVSNAEGSAYPAISAGRFAEMEFLLPPEKKLTEFENIVSPMLAKISQNELESQTLTELRDWLPVS